MKFYRDVLWATLYQIPLTYVDLLKSMAASGWGIFALYGYNANFKPSSQNPLKGFFRDVLWVTLYHISSTHVGRSKNMATSGRGTSQCTAIVQTSKIFLESASWISMNFTGMSFEFLSHIQEFCLSNCLTYVVCYNTASRLKAEHLLQTTVSNGSIVRIS